MKWRKSGRWRFPFAIKACRAAVLIAAWSAHGMRAAPPLEGYADDAAWRQQMTEIDASDRASMTSLGTTLGGRDILLLTVAKGEPDKKPGIVIVGNVVAPHLVGSELATRVARTLAAGAGDEKVKAATDALLDRFTFYVIPRPSPDAAELFFASPSTGGAANLRPTDDDRDGVPDEDGQEDLNGDGVITQVRVEDPEGEYIPHPKDARILIPADRTKQERGLYRVISEGVDNDHDEAFNEDGPGGVEFHRNFPFAYEFFQPGTGPHAVSELESRAVADFCFTHPNIALVFSFSPEDNLFNPWQPDSAADQARIKTKLLTTDSAYMKLLTERFQKVHGGTDAPESETYSGSFVRWAYFHYGRWSLASRAWWPPKTPLEAAKDEVASGEPTAAPAESDKKEKPEEDSRAADQLNALRWLDKQGIAGFVPWSPIEHPDFPGKKVEVGGFKPYVTLNPPAAELDVLAQKHVEFLTSLIEEMPRLELKEAQVESVGAGVFRMETLVVNDGSLPTLSEMGRISEQTYPLQVALTLPEGVKLLAGRRRQQIEPLAGNGGNTKLEWLLHATATDPIIVRIKVYAPAVGEVTKDVELK